MARADSTIRVNIIGDAKSLDKAAGSAERATGRIGKSAKIAGGLIAGAFAVDAVLDFAQTALNEADRIGDATSRLELQLGDLSGALIEGADDFARLGQSAQDMLELEARFADIATSAGIADETIASLADNAGATAAALALTRDIDADAALDLIGKAAAGSERPLRDLGVSLTDAAVEARALADTGKASADALTEGELAAARLALILEQLQPTLAGVAVGSGDVERKQAELQARWETLTGKIGQAVEGPLNDFLGWVLQGIDGLGQLDQFIALVEQGFRDALGPIAEVADGLRDLIGIIDEVLQGLGAIFRSRSVSVSGTIGGRPVPQGGITVQVQGGSPEVVEQAVKDAINHASGTGPLT